MTLAELKIGQKATIKSYQDEYVGERLMEMGCLPNDIIEIIRIPTFGDPIVAKVGGFEFAIRNLFNGCCYHGLQVLVQLEPYAFENLK